MNKKRIILGLLIAIMAVFMCGLWHDTPEVFATEVEEYATNEAGTYYGSGFYILGSQVTLKAEMNSGYKFDKWEITSDAGTTYDTNAETSFVATENITVKPIWHKIAYAVSVDGINVLNAAEMDYFITYSDELSVNSLAFCSQTNGAYVAGKVYKFSATPDGATNPYEWVETNDVNMEETLFAKFDIELTITKGTIHKDDADKDLKLYSDQVNITVAPKTSVYVYDITKADIKINENTIAQIEKSINPMNISCSITNDNSETAKVGFKTLTLNVGTLNQNVNLTANVTYMYTLTLESGNEIPFDEIKEFVGMAFYYSERIENKVYLVKNQATVVLNGGNDIYQAVKSVFNDEDPNGLNCVEQSRSLTLTKDSTLQIFYSKKGYTIDFATYLQNESGNNVLMESPLYNIPSKTLTAGESIEQLAYDSTDKFVIIDGETYEFPTDIYGYEFVGFAVGDELITDGAYTLSDTEPANTEIQIIFKYIEYEVEIEIIDDYFTADYDYTLSTTKLVKGTEITFTASTEKFQIVGWSLKNNPVEDADYLAKANEGDNNLSYKYTFDPTSDDTYTLIMYLDITYRYLTVEYSLANSSIDTETITNLTYDIVKHDEANNTLTFIDSLDPVAEEIISYEESDKITDADSITITTSNETIGNVVIDINNTMTYGTHGFISAVGTESNGVYEYVFEKQTTTPIYYGSLKATIIESINFTYSGNSATFSLIGTQFSEENASGESGVTIETVTLDMIETATGEYKIDQYHYTMYFYPSENRISLRGINFYYNEDSGTYILQYSERAREPIQAIIERSDTYSITLNNLLENHIIVYQTVCENEDFYQFSSFKNKNSSTLWSFTLGNANTCYLKAIDQPIVVVNYNKLSQSVLLRINNEFAYQDEGGNAQQIEYSVDGTTYTGEISTEISAIAGNVVVVSIEESKIAKGYKFVQFKFMNNTYLASDIYDEGSGKYTYSFTMDETYANKYFDIEFEQIRYNLNVVYVDASGVVIDGSVNGKLTLLNENQEYDIFSSGIVTIENIYKFKAIANTGYYVARAYIGAEAYTITSLQSNNNSTDLETIWILSTEDKTFQNAICENAGEYDATNGYYNVNLKIYFAIHTYSVKVYYEIESNASIITYPSLTMNGAVSTLNKGVIENGVAKYFAYSEGFEYNTDIELVLSNFMKGTGLKNWQDGTKVTAYAINGISQNTELIVTLQYIEYTINFEAIDMYGQKANVRGGGKTSNTAYKLFDTVNYTITTNAGYELKEVYYYNALGNKANIELTKTSFEFNPGNFSTTGNDVKIYLMFDLRTVTLNLSNERTDGEQNPLEINVSEWLDYTVIRKRDGKDDETLSSNYKFSTGDTLILDIKPKYVGIMMTEVKLGNITIGQGTDDPSYSLSSYYVEESGEVVGVGYTLTVTFVSTVIGSLEDNVDLVHFIQLRTYNIDYSYNLISFGKEFQFGVKLSVGNESTGSLATTDADVKYTEEVMFNSNMTFSYDKSTMNNPVTNKFVIAGFRVDGKDYDYDIANGALILNDVDIWNAIALDRLLKSSNDIQIVLMLTPQITLHNYDTDTHYRYTDTYNAQEQGLIVGSDVVVVEGFNVAITYNNSADLPINAGEYEVEVMATISGSAGTMSVALDEKIIYIINPAGITITMSEPLTKVYDGSKQVFDKQALVAKFKFNGICGSDQLTVDVTKLTAYYSDYKVSDKLMSISINNLILLEKNEMIPSTNYVISNGTDIVLDKAGQITQRELKISGFRVSDKVYDKENTVNVNTIDIIYQNKIEGDAAEINVDELKFYLDDFSIGLAREVKLDASEALTGADRANYKITYEKVYIDIYPNEISYTVKDYGTFKIVDADKKCLIPINATMIVKVYENGSEEFQHMYSKVQLEMGKNEKMKYCYKVALVIGGVEQMMPAGLHIYLPKAKKVTQVHQQASDSENIQEVKFASNNNYIEVKTERGRCVFAVVVDTTFLPLWAIILIVVGALIVVGGIVTIFIIVRVKAKRKYGSYDRI